MHENAQAERAYKAFGNVSLLEGDRVHSYSTLLPLESLGILIQ